MGNNDYRISDVNQTVKVHGFVSKKRNLGQLLFIDLRDTTGIIQLSFDENHPLKEEATLYKNESVLEVEGIIKERSNKNKDLKTGDIEIVPTKITLLNTAKQPPLLIQDDTDALEEVRLKYRYLDLRRPVLHNMIKLRHTIMQATRSFLNDRDFFEIETPILTKSTPEGARDYVVPSRLYEKEFYALPQSPQIFKQLLMIGGFERYYQIAKCFRDEDLRSDRQPEFTQIDMEMAFVTQEDVIKTGEALVKALFNAANQPLDDAPFQRLSYQEAMDFYGSDKPDLRFDLKIAEFTDVFKQSSLPIVKDKTVKGFIIKGKNDLFSRKVFDQFKTIEDDFEDTYFMSLKYDETLSGSVAKHILDYEQTVLAEKGFEKGDTLLLFASSDPSVACGRLRLLLKDHLALPLKNHAAAIITDFPMFEYDNEKKRYVSMHHPFTMPSADLETIKNHPENLLSNAYDIVIDGYEVGGGSIRIHDLEVQKAIFNHLGMDLKMAEERFGFFLEALSYGTPPHGGIAFGLDRLTMILGGTQNIRDVIAFPKTSKAQCLMSEAPGMIDESQRKELHLK